MGLSLMKVLGKQVYRFDNVEVDPAQGCLRRNGEELSVRQKSLQALLYLIEQRHRLVTKDELIERVWEGMAVSDAALVQLIKEIRDCLGDDHRHPRFIKTVPKGGYRFIAPVQELYLELSSAIEIERHESVEIEYEEEISDDPALNGDVGARLVESISPVPLLTRRRLVLVSAAAAILLFTGVATTYLLTRSARSSPHAEVTLPTRPGRKAVAVMYFDNQSRSPDLDWMREGLADLLITNLSRSKGLNVLSRQQLHLLVERSGHSGTEVIKLNEAMGIASKSRAEVIVLGSYVRLGEKIRIDVQLHNAQTGQPLASESTEADKAQDILAQLDLLSLKLASHLGAGPELRPSGTMVGAPLTTNLEAYRNYSLAVEKARGLQNVEAIRLLEKAIVLDPKFAMAYARIGYAYTMSWDLPDKAKPFLEKAFHLSDRLSDRDRLYVKCWYALANLDYAGAIGLLQEIIAVYPMEPEAYYRLSRLLSGEDRLPEALEVALRGLVVDPEFPSLLNETSGIYLRLGRNDEAIATAQRYIALTPHQPNAYDTLGLYYQWAGRYSEAIANYQRALSLDPQFDIAVVHLGNAYFQQGRYQEALERYKQYAEVAPSNEERGRAYASIAQLYRGQGDLARAGKAAKRAFEYHQPGSFQYAIVSADRGNLAVAEKLSERFLEGTITARGRRNTRRYPHYLRGYVYLRSGHSEEALTEFKQALRYQAPSWTIDSFEDCLAKAFLELGRFDEAIAEYQRVLDLNPNYPLAHFHLGQAYEGKGQNEQARNAYQRFLQVWKNADADVPEVISAMRKLALR
jgi:tetratricopeptide (TPR) repeat protein